MRYCSIGVDFSNLICMYSGADQTDPGRDPYENIDNIPHQSYPKSEPSMGQNASYSFTSNVPTYQA